jgi:hypothetical protein
VQQVANVVIVEKERPRELGTLVTHPHFPRMAKYTYYHHILPSPALRMGLLDNPLDPIMTAIDRLHKIYPEISTDGLIFDNVEAPELVDLGIDIHIPADTWEMDILQSFIVGKIALYIHIIESALEFV